VGGRQRIFFFVKLRQVFEKIVLLRSSSDIVLSYQQGSVPCRIDDRCIDFMDRSQIIICVNFSLNDSSHLRNYPYEANMINLNHDPQEVDSLFVLILFQLPFENQFCR
jgi:hypothetical protein